MDRLIVAAVLSLASLAPATAQLPRSPTALAALQAALSQIEAAATPKNKLSALERALAAERILPPQPNEAARTKLRAALKRDLAAALLSAHTPIQAADAARAADLMREPLTVFDTQEQRRVWRRMHAIIAVAEEARRDGDRETNLSHTIVAAKIALNELSAGLDPEWAGMQILLAEAYLEQRTGGRNENIARATAALWELLDQDFSGSDTQSARQLREWYFNDAQKRAFLQLNWLARARSVIATLEAALGATNPKAELETWGRLNLALGSAILAPQHIYAPGWHLDVT